MDSQDHPIKNDSSGYENHVCHKCGWSFPNPHPSAKHRRAHKKLCGTIEGYNLLELKSEDPQFSVLDDDHDDEYSLNDNLHTPSPGAKKGGGGGGGGGESNISDGETFASAVMEFSDNGVSSITGSNAIHALQYNDSPLQSETHGPGPDSELSLKEMHQSENATVDQSDSADVAESIDSDSEGIIENSEDYIVKEFGSSSRVDSLEANWGSVSVVSGQSDAQPPEKTETKKRTTDESHRDKLDSYEPPSFMTLVQSPNYDVTSLKSQKDVTEIESDHIDLQAGWFPSLSNVVNESQGRKKNEEIIAKVSNWSTVRQYNHPPVTHPPVTVTVTHSDETVGTKKEENHETEIKKVKGRKTRPYWVSFVCCSKVESIETP